MKVFSPPFLSENLTPFLLSRGHGEVVSREPLAGGSINRVWKIQTGDGQSWVLKEKDQAPPSFFSAERNGLEELAKVPQARGKQVPRVPAVCYEDSYCLLLEHLAPGRANWKTWPRFGRQLAALHQCTSPTFGFHENNYLGLTPQDNTPTSDGFAFFAQRRLVAQGQRAVDRGLLGTSAMRRLETLAAKLRDLVPDQPASLVHGDLWSGNIHLGEDSQAALIDPAAHYGWAEADLAMAHLFGTLPQDFHGAYQEVRPLEKGYRDRFDLYNLYHLLNHLNLFGLSYAEEVLSIIGKYS